MHAALGLQRRRSSAVPSVHRRPAQPQASPVRRGPERPPASNAVPSLVGPTRIKFFQFALVEGYKGVPEVLFLFLRSQVERRKLDLRRSGMPENKTLTFPPKSEWPTLTNADWASNRVMLS
jgi:hypothetical protein